jgi:hypothetical protein
MELVFQNPYQVILKLQRNFFRLLPTYFAKKERGNSCNV